MVLREHAKRKTLGSSRARDLFGIYEPPARTRDEIR